MSTFRTALTLALSMAAGLVFGLAPVTNAGALDVQRALRDGARGASGAHALWGRGFSLRRARSP